VLTGNDYVRRRTITDWMNVVTDVTLGADLTGQNDSTQAIKTAISMAAAQTAQNGDIVTGGVVYLPTGAYKVGSLSGSGVASAAVAPIYIRGTGPQSTTIQFYGSGACISLYQNYVPKDGSSGIRVWGGGISDLTIDGSYTTAVASGLHVGDMKFAEFCRINIRHFNQRVPSAPGWITAHSGLKTAAIPLQLYACKPEGYVQLRRPYHRRQPR